MKKNGNIKGKKHYNNDKNKLKFKGENKKYNIFSKSSLDLSQNRNINEIKEEIDISENTIEQLNNKIKELNHKLKSQNELNLNKIHSLEKIINQKDEEINKLKEKLQNNDKEKEKNKILEDKIKELNKELSEKIAILKEITNNLEIQKSKEKKLDSKEELFKILLEKERELKELKLQLSRYPMELKEGEKLMTVNFTAVDSRIQNYSIICKNTDIFNIIETKLYKDYKEYYDTENYFTVNGKKIHKNKTLDENNIHNNDTVILNIIDI